MTDSLVRLAFGALAPATVDRLIDAHGGIDGAVDALSAGRSRSGRSSRDAVSVPAAVRRRQLDERGITWVERPSAAYPARLDRFGPSPRWLFVRGDLPRGPTIAIVGTRTCTAYGIELATAYGAAAADAGWVVVSGLARGIDGAAHRGAVASGGRCLAVLGSGIDVVYPRRHRSLHDDILDRGGAIASEFPPGTRPDPWRFPTRNRIIAGIADVVLVVEASVSGGALITARIALDYGIPVFATPGDVDRPASQGTNGLIRDGAFPVFDASDLAAVLDLVVPFAEPARVPSATSSRR